MTFKRLFSVLILGLTALLAWLWATGSLELSHGSVQEVAAENEGSETSTKDGIAATLESTVSRSNFAGSAGTFGPSNTNSGGLRLQILNRDGEPIPNAQLQVIQNVKSNWNTFDVINHWSRIEDIELVLSEGATNKDGVVELVHLPLAREVTVVVTAPHYARRTILLRTPGPNEILDCGTYTLDVGRILKLQFVDESGNPVPGVDFSIFVKDEKNQQALRIDRIFYSVADDSGAAVLPNIPLGAVELTTRESFLERRIRYQIPPGESFAKLTLPQSLEATGVILEEDGMPVQGAEVSPHSIWHSKVAPGELYAPWGVSHFDYSVLRSTVLSEADGRFRCVGIPPNTNFVITAFVAPNQLYSSTVQESVDDIEFIIPKRHEVVGRIVGLDHPQDCVVNFEYRGPISGDRTESPRFSFEIVGVEDSCGTDGRFRRQLPEGKYRVRAWAPGMNAQLIQELNVNQAMDLGELSFPPGGQVLLRVPELTSRWAENFDVEVWSGYTIRLPIPGSSSMGWRLLSGLQPDRSQPGFLRFQNLPSTPLWFIVDVPGFLPAGYLCKEGVAEEETLEHVLNFEPPAMLRLRVLGAGDTPKANLQVICRPIAQQLPHPAFAILDVQRFSSLPAWKSQITALDGVARFYELPPGRYEVLLAFGDPDDRLEVHDLSLTEKIAEVDLKTGVERELEYRLDGFASIRIAVFAEGAPVEGAPVAIWKNEENRPLLQYALPQLRSGTTSAEGVFFAEGLSEGNYFIGAKLGARDVWTTTECQLSNLLENVRLDIPQGAVRFRVIDQTGAGIRGRAVISPINPLSAKPLDLLTWSYRFKLGWTYTDSDGRGRFERILPGKYRLHVEGAEQWQMEQFSPLFEIDDDEIDLGEIQIALRTQCSITVHGLSSWQNQRPNIFLERCRDGILYAALSVRSLRGSDVDQDEQTVIAGEYAIVICDADGKRLWKSDIFKASSGESIDVTIQIPSPASIGAEH